MSLLLTLIISNIWVKVFKNGPSKICGRRPLKILLGTILNSFTHIYLAEAYSELKQAFKMGLFAKTVNRLKSLTIFAKSSILDV